MGYTAIVYVEKKNKNGTYELDYSYNVSGSYANASNHYFFSNFDHDDEAQELDAVEYKKKYSLDYFCVFSKDTLEEALLRECNINFRFSLLCKIFLGYLPTDLLLYMSYEVLSYLLDIGPEQDIYPWEIQFFYLKLCDVLRRKYDGRIVFGITY
jgi:hypothetical protein